MSDQEEKKPEPQLSPFQLKDLQKGNFDTPYVTPEMLNRLLLQTGAKAAVIVLLDSEMPCPETIDGRVCLQPHKVNVFVRGIEQKYTATFLSLLQQVVKFTPPTEI